MRWALCISSPLNTFRLIIHITLSLSLTFLCVFVSFFSMWLCAYYSLIVTHEKKFQYSADQLFFTIFFSRSSSSSFGHKFFTGMKGTICISRISGNVVEKSLMKFIRPYSQPIFFGKMQYNANTLNLNTQIFLTLTLLYANFS